MDTPDLKLLTIPTKSEDIQISADELPEIAEEIIQIFVEEGASLDVWLSFAREYYAQGKVASFLEILEKATESEAALSDQAREQDTPAQTALVDLYDTLAGYYLDLASKERDKDERKKPFSKAMQYYNLADSVRSEVAASYAGKGIWGFRSGQSVKQALDRFNVALEIDAEFVPALLGKAELLFSQGEHEKALKLYIAALRLYPDAPTSLRVGIAHCLFRLGKIDAARATLERAIEMDPKCTDALAALGVLIANSKETSDIASSINMFQSTFKQDSRHPVALNHLANHFRVRTDYDKAMGLAQVAYHSTAVPTLQAESCYIIARCHHACERFDDATSYYRHADRLSKNYIPAQYGLGQMFVKQNELTKAIQCFMRVEAKYPDDRDTLRVLASLCARSQDKRQQMDALPRLRRLAKLCPTEAIVHIELGVYLEKSNPKEALKSYEEALKLFTGQNRAVPVSLLNNIGALRHHLSGGDPAQVTRAVTAYSLAVRASGAKLEVLGDEETQFDDDIITTLYNMARVAEEQDLDRAESLYKAIIDHQPYYIDCWLRLGMMALAKEDVGSASKAFMEAINFDKDSIDAWVLIGNLHLKRQEWLLAQRKFEHILSSIDAQDPYALVALGNVFYYAFYAAGSRNDKAEKYAGTALKYFSKVITDDPYNIPAAAGTCIMLCERGRMMEVKDSMTQISELSDNESSWINIAHVALAQGQFVKAIKTYSMCLKRFGSKNVRVMGYLAKAYFEAAEYENAINMLRHAIHMRPHDPSLRFNLALCKRDLVTQLSKSSTSTSTDVEGVLGGLDVTELLLKGLAHSVPAHTVHWHDRVDPLVAQNILATMDDVRAVGVDAISKKKEEERLLDLRKAQLQKELEEAEATRREKEVEKKKLEEEREKALLNMQGEIDKEFEGSKRKGLYMREKKRRRKKRQKSGEEGVEGVAPMEIERQVVEGEVVGGGPSLQDLFGDMSSDDEEYQPEADKKDEEED